MLGGADTATCAPAVTKACAGRSNAIGPRASRRCHVASSRYRAGNGRRCCSIRMGRQLICSIVRIRVVRWCRRTLGGSTTAGRLRWSQRFSKARQPTLALATANVPVSEVFYRLPLCLHALLLRETTCSNARTSTSYTDIHIN